MAQDGSTGYNLLGNDIDVSKIADEEIRKIFPTAYDYKKHAEMGTRLKAEAFVDESGIRDLPSEIKEEFVRLGGSEKKALTELNDTIKTYAKRYAGLFMKVCDELMEQDITRIYPEDGVAAAGQ